MKDWKNMIVSPQETIRETIQIIDDNAMQIALVIDGDGRLLGTITDGDVRRGILRGISLEETVIHIMNASPITASACDNQNSILSLMKRNKLRHIPVIDKQGCLIRMEILENFMRYQPKENWTLLMAGGLGLRLRPLTENYPKPLLKVGDKPILETIIDHLLEYGFYRFFISVNYKADMIKAYFGDGSRWGAEIRYIDEPKRMGTAGALSLIPIKLTEPIVVMNGDLLTKLNFQQLSDFHTKMDASATICIHQYDFQVPYGVIKTEEQRLIDIEEKPMHRFFVNAGIYVLDASVLPSVLKEAYVDMPTLLKKLMIENRKISVFPIREYWLDIGKMEDFNRANRDFYEVFR